MAIKIARTISLFVLLAFVGPAHASDLAIPQSTLYPFRSTVEIQDDFMNESTSSGTIGDLNFSTLNGLSVIIPGEAGRPGLLRRTTTTVISTAASLKLGSADVSFIPSDTHSILFVVRLNTNDANTTVRIGSYPNSVASPFPSGIYLEKLDGDTNWFCVTRNAGVQTRTDSTIAITTGFVNLAYRRDSSGVQFSINQVNVCSVISTNIPTAGFHPGVFIINSAAADKTIDIDYFQMKITGLAR